MIDLGREPDYTGIFKDGPTVNVFNLYIMDRNAKGTSPESIMGVIQDNVGMAGFTGERTHLAIRFEKSYFPGTPNAGRDVLVYEGKLEDDGTIRGSWSNKYQTNRNGAFNMQPVKAEARASA